MIYAFIDPRTTKLLTLTSRKKAIKYVTNNYFDDEEVTVEDIEDIDRIVIQGKTHSFDIYVSEPNSIEDVPKIKDDKGNFGIEEKYAMMHGYSDIKAFEIVNVISDRTIEVRRLNATRGFKPEFEVGGFSAHCTNNDNQKWTFESDESNPIIRLRKAKNSDYWLNRGTKFRIGKEPYEKYDYNF